LPTDGELGVDHCGDCAIMTQTFDNYRAKWGCQTATLDMISKLLYVCRRNLFDGSIHGHYTHKYRDVKHLISVQKKAYEALVVEFVAKPSNFTPLTIGQAYVYHTILLEAGSDLALQVSAVLFGSWLLGWHNKITGAFVSDNLLKYGVDYQEVVSQLNSAQPIEVHTDEKSIRIGEFSFDKLPGINTELQAIAQLTMSVSEIAGISSPVLDRFSNYKLITKNPAITINGREPDYNVFVDNIFNLPKDKYFVYIPRASHIGRLLISRHFEQRKISYVLLTSMADRYEKNLLSETHEEFDADIVNRDGSKSTKRCVIYWHDY
jgi:hypothetical protein